MFNHGDLPIGHDPLQRRILLSAGALGAAVTAATVPLLLLALDLIHYPLDVLVDYGCSLLIMAVVVSVILKAQTRAVERHNALRAAFEDRYTELLTRLNEGRIEDRAYVIDLMDRNLRAIEDKKIEHKQREFN